MSTRRICTGWLIAICLTTSVPAWARTFRDRTGRTMEAEIVAAQDATVTVLRSDGKRLTFNIQILCDEDREYVRQW